MNGRQPRPGSKRDLMLRALEGGDKTTVELAKVSGLSVDDARQAMKLMSAKGLAFVVEEARYLGWGRGTSAIVWTGAATTRRAR